MRNRLSLFWTLQLLGWGAYGLMIYITFLPMLPAEGGRMKLLEIKLVRTIIGFGLSLILHQIYRRCWRRSLSFRSIAIIALACSVVFGCVWLVLSKFYAWLVDPSFTIEPLTHRYPREALDYSYVLFAWSASYFGVKYWQQWQAERETSLKATALAHKAQLDMLRYQLNPHFLFNALNSIRALVDEDQARAKRMVTEFSEFLRYSLLNANSSQVPLREEIEAIRSYLDIEKIRFDDRLEVIFDIEPRAAQCSLPGFLIHPLVDNAINHGLQSEAGPLVIRTIARIEGDRLRIEVANTGRWVNNGNDHSPSGAGIGLKNVRQRLEQIYPDRSRFHVGESDGWVRAVIEIDGAKSRRTDEPAKRNHS